MRLEFFTLKTCCAEHSGVRTAYPTRNGVSNSRIYFAHFIVYVRESHCISKHWIEDHSDKLRVHSRFPRINGAPQLFLYHIEGLEYWRSAWKDIRQCRYTGLWKYSLSWMCWFRRYVNWRVPRGSPFPMRSLISDSATIDLVWSNVLWVFPSLRLM